MSHPAYRRLLFPPASQPRAYIRPIEAQIAATAENRQRLAGMLATAPALLVNPADSDLKSLGQLRWRQNILRFHRVLAGSLCAVTRPFDAPRMRCLCYNYVAILMRPTAATTAPSNEADIAKVQEWLGHANVSTVRLYDRRKTRSEDSPTFHVKY